MSRIALRVTAEHVELAALATAHSHAFQRGLRGAAQRARAGDEDFWSWREAMYALADRLDPDEIHRISRVAFGELARAGVRTVGEFHYVHHQRDGTPYEDRTVLAEAVITAAKDAGLRIALLRVVYGRAGAGRPPEGTQRRFSDAELDDAFADVDVLAARHRRDPDVVIGIAPHSVRAVPPDWLVRVADFASRRSMPVHMHVAEQPAEVEACIGETGRRPLELCADSGLISERFVAVHATHLASHEPMLLGQASARVCLCPTTERDLGDGLPDVTALVAAGVSLCVGVDSHVLTSPLEDIRGVELGERLRTLRRVTLRPTEETPAEMLWRIGSVEGANACGFADSGGMIRYDRSAPELALCDDEHILEAIVFGGAHLLPVPSPPVADG